MTENSEQDGISDGSPKSEADEVQQDITEIIASIMGLLMIKKQDKINDLQRRSLDIR